MSEVKADDLAGASILVVDDVADNVEMLQRRLKARGFTVHTAANGRQALQTIAEEQIDLVLLDIMMLDVSGIEVLKLVRAKISPAKLPIVMVSARDDEAMVVHALAAGANDYVRKPHKFGELLARIVSHLRTRRQYQSLQESHLVLKQKLAALQAAEAP
jgi:DNA-binding response OmpR family regulator